jgi:phage terminase small subunit
MTFDLIKAQNALTEKQRNFVELWLVHRNAHYAYVEAYEAKRMSPATAYRDGHRMLRHPKIAPIIEARLTALGEALTDETEMSVARVLDAFVELAKADPDEVTGVRVGACRYCHGVDHMYQWTPAEFAEATRKAEKAETELPDPRLAVWTSTVRPSLTPRAPSAVARASCGKCRLIPPSYPQGARALFAGVKPTANGLEIKLRDRGQGTGRTPQKSLVRSGRLLTCGSRLM